MFRLQFPPRPLKLSFDLSSPFRRPPPPRSGVISTINPELLIHLDRRAPFSNAVEGFGTEEIGTGKRLPTGLGYLQEGWTSQALRSLACYGKW